MLKSYRAILSIPGAAKFSAAGLLARFPMSMTGIAIILMISTLYGNYSVAGQVAGVGIISFAAGAPLLARLVDTHGQSRIMRPALAITSLSLVAICVCAYLNAPLWAIFLFSALAGGCSGSLGALVRARWSHVLGDPDRLHTAFALEAVFDEIVFMIGPIIATLLTTLVHPTAGLLSTVLFIIFGGFWFLSQRATEPPPVTPNPGEKTHSVMHSGAMVAMFLTFVATGIMFGANDVATVAFSDQHNWKSAAGMLLAIYAAGSMISGAFYGARSWRIPITRLLLVGLVVLAIGNTFFLLANSITSLAVIMFFTGFAISPTAVNVNNIVQRLMPAGRLTEGLTWLSTAMNLGVSVGSALAGSVIDASDARGGFWVMVVAAWFMVFIGVVTLPLINRSLAQARSQAAQRANLEHHE